jgi:hypothetical protein
MSATIPSLRAFKRGAMLGTVLPTGDTLDTHLPTFAYIAIVSLLDDGLEAVTKEWCCRGSPIESNFLKPKGN